MPCAVQRVPSRWQSALDLRAESSGAAVLLDLTNIISPDSSIKPALGLSPVGGSRMYAPISGEAPHPRLSRRNANASSASRQKSLFCIPGSSVNKMQMSNDRRLITEDSIIHEFGGELWNAFCFFKHSFFFFFLTLPSTGVRFNVYELQILLKPV